MEDIQTAPCATRVQGFRQFDLPRRLIPLLQRYCRDVPPHAVTAATHTARAPGRANHGFDLLADELLAAMGAIRRSGRRHAGRPAELSQLTGSQLELVRLLRRRPGISVNQVAEELNLAPNTVSTLVRQLVDAGFVVRRRQEAARRVARLDLAEDLGRKMGRFFYC